MSTSQPSRAASGVHLGSAQEAPYVQQIVQTSAGRLTSAWSPAPPRHHAARAQWARSWQCPPAHAHVRCAASWRATVAAARPQRQQTRPATLVECPHHATSPSPRWEAGHTRRDSGHCAQPWVKQANQTRQGLFSSSASSYTSNTMPYQCSGVSPWASIASDGAPALSSAFTTSTCPARAP